MNVSEIIRRNSNELTEMFGDINDVKNYELVVKLINKAGWANIYSDKVDTLNKDIIDYRTMIRDKDRKITSKIKETVKDKLVIADLNKQLKQANDELKVREMNLQTMQDKIVETNDENINLISINNELHDTGHRLTFKFLFFFGFGAFISFLIDTVISYI